MRRNILVTSTSIFKTITDVSLKLFSRGQLILILLLFCLVTTAALAWPRWLSATSSGGSGSSFSNAIKVASNGDQYVTGQFSSSSKFFGTTLLSKGGLDVFLAKYAASGKLQWIVQAG